MTDLETLLRPLITDEAGPPVAELARRASRRQQRRRVGAGTALLLVAVLVALSAIEVRHTEQTATVRLGGGPAPSPPIPPLPAGWQGVTYGTVAFDVPADFTVFPTAHCIDFAHPGVYLVTGPSGSGDGCSGTVGAMQITLARTDPSFQMGAPTANETVNGLQLQVHDPNDAARPDEIDVLVASRNVLVMLRTHNADDLLVARQIITTIHAAPHPEPFPPPPPFVTPTTLGPAEFCQAVEAFRQSHTLSPSGDFTKASAPYLQRLLDTAPPEAKAPIQTLLNWASAGKAGTMPPDVVRAAQTSMTQWLAHCNSSGVPGP